MTQPSQRAVLWDLDGTLADTGELHYLSWARTLAARNIPYSREVFRHTFGMNNANSLNVILGHPPTPELLLELSEEKEASFRDDVRGNAQLLPGALDWLVRLQQNGIPQAIASSAPQANIDALVDELQIRSYFGAIVSGMSLPSKPNPHVFLAAAQALNVEPQYCIVVEDAIAGVGGAKNAGMHCIAVTTTSPAEALHQADLVIDRLDHLPLNAFETLF
jgi:HAD superfamily hydrolase (TIGR01509 family)